MRAIIIGFGLLILCLLILFRIGEVNFLKGNVQLEVIIAIVAFIFFFVGLYFNYQTGKKAREEASSTPTPPPPGSIDHEQIKRLGLTQREHDVLLKMAEGLSNLEIANSLFLSESTIKTHVSNVLFKLDAKRRTQAIQTAKQLRIVP